MRYSFLTGIVGLGLLLGCRTTPTRDYYVSVFDVSLNGKPAKATVNFHRGLVDSYFVEADSPAENTPRISFARSSYTGLDECGKKHRNKNRLPGVSVISVRCTHANESNNLHEKTNVYRGCSGNWTIGLGWDFSDVVYCSLPPNVAPIVEQIEKEVKSAAEKVP